MVAMIFVILFGIVDGLRGTMLNASAEHNWVLLSNGAHARAYKQMRYTRRTTWIRSSDRSNR